MNKFLRYVTLVGIFIVPFIPLIVSNTLFFPFITGKNFTFRIVIEIAFAAWIILAATNKAYRPRRSWILYSFAALIVIMALADATGVSAFKSFWSNYERMEGWVTLAHLFAYFLVASTMLAKEKMWDAFFQTSLGVNMVVILYSLFQITKLLTINQGGVRIDATFGNATYLAIYALFHIFIAGLYLIKTQAKLDTRKNTFLALGFNIGFFLFILPLLQHATIDKTHVAAVYGWAFAAWVGINVVLFLTVYAKQERVMLALILAFNLITLYNTATRGAILGLIGGVMVTGVLIAIFEKERMVVRKTALGVLVAALVVVLGFFAIRNTTFVRSSPVLTRFASISISETTTLSRFKLWNMALKGFGERPILGWGQENFNYVFNKYYNPQLYNQEQWFDRTHNVFFDWLIAGGILGFAAYFTLFGSVIYYVWRKRDSGDDSFTIAEKGVLTGMLAAYFIHNFFVFDNITSYLVYISVVAYVYNRTSMRPQAESEPVRNQVVAPLALVALLLVFYSVNARPLTANKALIRGISIPSGAPDVSANVEAFKKSLSYNSFGTSEAREQLMTLSAQFINQQTQPKGANEFIVLANEQAKKQIEDTPEDARYRVFYGTFLARFGENAGAIEQLNYAQKLSPTKQSILFALAGTYMNQNDYVNAAKWLKVAYELEPNYLEARLVYAAALVYSNNMPEADKILTGLSTSSVARSNDLVQAYFANKQYTRLIQLLKQRLADEPAVQNHISLAVVYMAMENRSAAVAEIEKAIALDPTFKEQGDAYIKEIRAGKSL